MNQDSREMLRKNTQRVILFQSASPAPFFMCMPHLIASAMDPHTNSEGNKAQRGEATLQKLYKW